MVLFKICKRCSFECGIGKYSTRPRNKVWAFRQTPYPLYMCCIFPYRTKMNTVCIFSYDCPTFSTAQISVQLADMTNDHNTRRSPAMQHACIHFSHISNALLCTACKRTSCMASGCCWLSVCDSSLYGRLSSVVMSVDCTLLCAVKIVGQSCEKIQTVLIFVRYGKIQHMSKE